MEEKRMDGEISGFGYSGPNSLEVLGAHVAGYFCEHNCDIIGSLEIKNIIYMTQEELKALVEKIQKGTATEEEIELFVNSADEFADEIASLQK